MRNEIGVDPLDRVAAMGGDLRRNESGFFNPDLHDLGARICRREDEIEFAPPPRRGGAPAPATFRHRLRQFRPGARACPALHGRLASLDR
jgi:hypothetical protein